MAGRLVWTVSMGPIGNHSAMRFISNIMNGCRTQTDLSLFLLGGGAGSGTKAAAFARPRPRYRGTCRALSAAEIEQRLAQGVKPTLRFCVPVHEEILFHDLIKGPQKFNSSDIGDFIIRRADGTASFMFLQCHRRCTDASLAGSAW